MLVGQAVSVMALMDRSQLGGFLVPQRGVVLIVRPSAVPFASEFRLSLRGDELEPPARRQTQLSLVASLRPFPSIRSPLRLSVTLPLIGLGRNAFPVATFPALVPP